MTDDHFTTVFDLTTSGFKNWTFSAFGLIFVAIGLVMFFAPMILKRSGMAYLDFPSKRFTFFRYFFLGFALFWTAISFTMTFSAYSRHRDLIDRNACTVVTGQITDFVPMPYTGHADESFSVSGVTFSYSDYGASDAFNNTSSHGGPIKKGSYLRICYDPSDHAILRLEIRNFQGPLKDYSRSDALFADNEAGSPTPASPTPRVEVPEMGDWSWLASVWVVFYFFDFFAVIAMVRPYFRRSWRLTTIPLDGIAVPPWLDPGRRIKLRNSLVFWDVDHATIWLRPRGFNIARVPFAVAKLNTDSGGRRVESMEVRFAFGLPITFALFFLSAYFMFSSVTPGHNQEAAFFVGFAFLIFVLAAGFQRKRTISRMELLVRDALDEFSATCR